MEPGVSLPETGRQFNDLEEAAWHMGRELARGLLERCLEALDEELYRDRPAGLRVHGVRTRSVLTLVGTVRFRRRYYRTSGGGTSFLLDEAVGLEPRRRLSKRVERLWPGYVRRP